MMTWAQNERFMAKIGLKMTKIHYKLQEILKYKTLEFTIWYRSTYIYHVTAFRIIKNGHMGTKREIYCQNKPKIEGKT